MLRPAIVTENPPLPLLVTGVAGVAGYNAQYWFAERFAGQVIGIRQRDNWRLAGPGIVACDAESREELERLFDRHRFAAVLNCAGNCALKSCELDPDMAWRINVEGVRNLLEVAVPRGARLVHLSIDLVFSGTGQGGYRETSPADPVTVYGKTMLLAERMVLAADPGACVLRISLPMGVSFNGHAGAIDWIRSRFRHGRPATLYYDEIRTPAYTDCLNELFAAVLASRLAGVYHAGGPRPLSLFRIAQIVNRVGGYDPRLLIGLPRRRAAVVPPRAGNVALDSSRLVEALGFAPLEAWPSDPELVPTHDEWHFERPAGRDHSFAELVRVLYCNPGRGVIARPPLKLHA